MMVAKKAQTWDVVDVQDKNKITQPITTAFKRKKLSEPQQEHSQQEQSVPAWIIMVFIFAVVFCLFAIYKVFIYGRGYDFSPIEQISLPITGSVQEVSFVQEGETMASGSGGNQSIELHQNVEMTSGAAGLQVAQDIDRNADVQLIQNFYQQLVTPDVDAMNTLVHRPLKNSITWQNHWNTKNLRIFTNNLVGDLSLSEVFLIPGSVNAAKQSRQYSYVLKYMIQPNHSFTEDWKVTLLTQADGKVVISEIMCTTTGCSRSPFFWPQNYGLK